MHNNNEMVLVAELLNDPRTITEIEIDPEWFESKVFQGIVTVIIGLAGSNYRVKDVYRELRAKQPFEAMTESELELLKGSHGMKFRMAPQLAEAIHSDFVERELQKATADYANTPSDSLAQRIGMLVEERSTLRQPKRTGELSGALAEFDEMRMTDNLLLKSFSNLDEFFGGGFSGGQLVIIGARPAVGKTALGIQLAENIVEKNEGCRSDFFSLEMTQWQVTSRIVARKAFINAILLKNPKSLTKENAAKCRQQILETMKKDLRIYDDRKTLNAICYEIKKRAIPRKYVAVIDYAGLISVQDSRKDERRTLNEVTRRLKELTTDLNITIILLAQLSRGIEARQDKRPTLADLKESGSLEQDANIVMLLSRDEKDQNKIICDIAKNREGINGTAVFKFIGQYQKITVDHYGAIP